MKNLYLSPLFVTWLIPAKIHNSGPDHVILRNVTQNSKKGNFASYQIWAFVFELVLHKFPFMEIHMLHEVVTDKACNRMLQLD